MSNSFFSSPDWKLLAEQMTGEEERPEIGWTQQDLAEMMSHQLEAPVTAGVDAGRSIRSILTDPSPALWSLQWIKALARDGGAGDEGPPPPEIGAVLYYGAIAAARVRLGQRITRLQDGQITAGLAWVLQQPWLDRQTRDLFDHLSRLTTA